MVTAQNSSKVDQECDFFSYFANLWGDYLQCESISKALLMAYMPIPSVYQAVSHPTCLVPQTVPY